jgi:hypothetical protein
MGLLERHVRWQMVKGSPVYELVGNSFYSLSRFTIQHCGAQRTSTHESLQTSCRERQS